MAGFWDRLKQGMAKTRENLGDKLRSIFRGREWSDDLWDELEEVLYEADLGAETVTDLLEQLHQDVRAKRPGTADEVLALLKERMIAILQTPEDDPWVLPDERPAVWLMVGVNGTGKTTTAGKFAAMGQSKGYRVVLGASDTFRAAAVEQLQEWGKRAQVDVIRQANGADPAAVAYDTVQSAQARGDDLAIIDTAGRLHNKFNLMQELQKIVRVIQKAQNTAPHAVWLVLDATTGQNGLNQARVFLEATAVSGIVLTKLDGTAKGGIALSVARELKVPVRFVGVGEKVEDLMPFDAVQYVDAILGEILNEN
ncbi:MAG: signal recognition particle-docking protein FtsY [Firmicutes bacterium]|nr:signal recognition particle-docking protein FtsY [Bacillota bacterium]